MRIIQILSVTVILVALNTTQAWAGAVNQCSLQTLRPDDRIDPGVAIGVCKQAVEAEPTPQHYFQLGRALYAAERYDESAQWFERAAASGHAEALFALGKSYYFGYGVKKDVLKGGRTMREAAQAGSVRAQDYVASLQFRGAAGVGGGRRQAMLGWKQAAEQGYFISYSQEYKSCPGKMAGLYGIWIGGRKDETAKVFCIHCDSQRCTACRVRRHV